MIVVDPQNPKLVFVTGPTAAGKTEFAIKAAREAERQLGGPCEIINSDSVQVFKEVEIGTAKPTLEQQKQVPHHLINFVEAKENYTAGEYRRDALAVINDGKKRGVRAFLIVGGSGFYVQALEKGMFEIPAADARVRIQLQDELQKRGLNSLYEELAQKDPAYAAKIAAQDSYRILRGLEIFYGLGKTMSEVQNEFAQKENLNDLARSHQILKFGVQVDRAVLRQRVRERTKNMLKAGWIQEVQALRARGLSDWAPLQSVGYRDIQNWLEASGGTVTSGNSQELEDQIVISTMQLAKRQATWFRRDPAMNWVESESADTNAPPAQWSAALKILNLRLADLTQASTSDNLS